MIKKDKTNQGEKMSLKELYYKNGTKPESEHEFRNAYRDGHNAYFKCTRDTKLGFYDTYKLIAQLVCEINEENNNEEEVQSIIQSDEFYEALDDELRGWLDIHKNDKGEYYFNSADTITIFHTALFKYEEMLNSQKRNKK